MYNISSIYNKSNMYNEKNKNNEIKNNKIKVNYSNLLNKNNNKKTNTKNDEIKIDKNVSVVKHIYKAKFIKQANKINSDYYKWYCYYKLDLNYLYFRLLEICKYNKIIIKDTKQTFLNFVQLMYMNSSNNKIPKHLLNVL